MFYDHDSLLLAAEPLPAGFKSTVVTLVEGDTAMAPGTTKKVLKGTGVLTYLWFPDGMVTVNETFASVTLVHLPR